MKKNVIYIILLFALFFNVEAQEKVLEKSERKIPSWVHATLEDYIITYASGSDIDEAKTNLVIKIKSEIVNSVASYVRSTTEIDIENINKGNIVSTLEKFKQTASIQTADIPFLKGISLSKAEGYYWEKTQNKNTGKISYTYHIKYPFANAALHRLIMEFNKYDQQMTDKMNEIVSSSKKTTSIEELDQHKKQLAQLSEYFIDSRKEQAALEIKRIESQVKQIDINVIENSPGKLVYNLLIGGVEFTTSQKPTFKKSECIIIESRETNGSDYEVYYNYENCYEDEENTITISYRYGNTKLSKEYAIDISSNKVELFMKDPIRLSLLNDDGSGSVTFKCKVPVTAKYPGKFKVDKVVLEYEGKPAVQVPGNVQVFEGKGLHEVNLTADKPVSKSDYSAISGTDINGYVYYLDINTGEKKSCRFYNIELTTDW